MVIRRIRAHVGTHNWFAVAIDLAIVVIGVFIGTQVSNWNDARVQRQEAREYRSRLIEELRSDESQIRQKIAYYGAVKKHGLRVLQSLEDPSAELGPNFLVDAYQSAEDNPARIKRFIFDEMVSAGLLGLLGSEDERLTADFYQQVDTYNAMLIESPPYGEALRQDIPYPVQSEMRAHCADQIITYNKTFVGGQLAEACPVKFSPNLVKQAVANIRGDPGLKPLATRYISSLDGKVAASRTMLELAASVRQELSRPH